MEVPPEKQEILREAEEQVARFQRAYSSGFISNGERYNKVIDTWTHANNDVADAMVRRLETPRRGSTRST
jgi:DNA-directed RNA polymerase subunit beta'